VLPFQALLLAGRCIALMEGHCLGRKRLHSEAYQESAVQCSHAGQAVPPENTQSFRIKTGSRNSIRKNNNIRCVVLTLLYVGHPSRFCCEVAPTAFTNNVRSMSHIRIDFLHHRGIQPEAYPLLSPGMCLLSLWIVPEAQVAWYGRVLARGFACCCNLTSVFPSRAP
jgi:hypothetical protein